MRLGERASCEQAQKLCKLSKAGWDIHEIRTRGRQSHWVRREGPGRMFWGFCDKVRPKKSGFWSSVGFKIGEVMRFIFCCQQGNTWYIVYARTKFPIYKVWWMREASQNVHIPVWKNNLKHSTAEFQSIQQLQHQQLQSATSFMSTTRWWNEKVGVKKLAWDLKNWMASGGQ